MIIITNEMLLDAFGRERVPFCRDLFMYSLKSLIEREEYGKDITAITQYEPQWDAQCYWDYWLDSTIANKEAEEYFKGEDNMNKYETLLKKYEALYKDFEDYRQVTEDIADKGTYVRNEAFAELLECKKKYYELEEDNDKLRNTIDSIYEGKKKLKEERDGIKKENNSLYKEFTALKKERDDLVKEVYYLHEVINEKNSKYKEKMDKIKQRDKQITELIKRRDIKDNQMTELIKERDKLTNEKNALHTLYTETAKERDNFEKRLDHINAMSNLEWKFEVEETKPTTSPYDDLVPFCEYRMDNGEGCLGCPKVIACDGINKCVRPAKWTEQQKEEYNELMNMDIAEYCNNVMNNKEDK